MGILMYVAMNVMGRGEDYKLTTMDFITDLGLAGLGGFLVGGPYGALAAFTVMLAIDVWDASVKEAQRIIDGFSARPIMTGVDAPYAMGESYTRVPDYIDNQRFLDRYFGGQGASDYFKNNPDKTFITVESNMDVTYRNT